MTVVKRFGFFCAAFKFIHCLYDPSAFDGVALDIHSCEMFDEVLL